MLDTNLEIHPEAIEEFFEDEAYDPALVDRFSDSVTRCLKRISEHP